VWALAAWQAGRPEAMNGAHIVDLDRLLGSVGSAHSHMDQPGFQAVPASILMPSPAAAPALNS
jgi:hypothetical protein